MILGDSLNVMASLAEREALRGKVQMIYIDPPYGIKFGSNWQASARKRDVKDGKLEDATREVEQIKAFRDTWELGIHSYLTYLRDRLHGREGPADRERIDLRPDRRRERASRAVADGRGVWQRELRQPDLHSRRQAASAASRRYLCARGHVTTLLWYATELRRAKYRQLYRINEPDRESVRTAIHVCEAAGRRAITDLSAAQKSATELTPEGRIRSDNRHRRNGGVRQQ